MAEVRRTGGAGRSRYQTTAGTRKYVYVDGTAVRKLSQVPADRPDRRQRTQRTQPANQAGKRERVLTMNMGYVVFLTVAAVITVFMCVNFLQLQARETKLQKEVTALETQLNSAILENDADYNRIMMNVDMEQVKDVAMNQLGMVYARKSQIVTYQLADRDYVRQYAEIPKE